MASYKSKLWILEDNSSNANFDAWGLAIHNAIAACGWTQTTDTGQVNWGSNPAVPSSSYLYEIWQPADALQTGSTKYFLKVEYGYNSTTIRVQLSIGTGTSGAGALTGIIIGPYYMSQSNQGANPIDCYVSGDIDRLTFMMWRNSSAWFSFSIERLKNGDGSNSTTGVMFFMNNIQNAAINNTICQVLEFSQSLGSSSVNVTGIPSGVSYPYGSCPHTIGMYNGIFNILGYDTQGGFPIYPTFIEYNGKLSFPLTTIVMCALSPVLESMLGQLQLYGQTRTFFFTTNVTNQFAGNNNGTYRVGFRFD